MPIAVGGDRAGGERREEKEWQKEERERKEDKNRPCIATGTVLCTAEGTKGNAEAVQKTQRTMAQGRG